MIYFFDENTYISLIDVQMIQYNSNDKYTVVFFAGGYTYSYQQDIDQFNKLKDYWFDIQERRIK